MALAAVEAVKAIGEGSRRPQTAYRHHWVLTGLANKLFLKALWVGVDRGAEALDNWGLVLFYHCYKKKKSSATSWEQEFKYDPVVVRIYQHVGGQGR